MPAGHDAGANARDKARGGGRPRHEERERDPGRGALQPGGSPRKKGSFLLRSQRHPDRPAHSEEHDVSIQALGDETMDALQKAGGPSLPTHSEEEPQGRRHPPGAVLQAEKEEAQEAGRPCGREWVHGSLCPVRHAVHPGAERGGLTGRRVCVLHISHPDHPFRAKAFPRQGPGQDQRGCSGLVRRDKDRRLAPSVQRNVWGEAPHQEDHRGDHE